MEELITQEDYFALRQKANYRGELGQPWQRINKRMMAKLFNQDYKDAPQFEYEIQISNGKENKKVKRRKINTFYPILQTKCENILKTNKELLRAAYNFCQQDSFQCYTLEDNHLKIFQKGEELVQISKPPKAASYLVQIKHSICEKQEIQYESIKQQKENIMQKQEQHERKPKRGIESKQYLQQKQKIVRSKSTLFMFPNKNNDLTSSDTQKEKIDELFPPSIKRKSKSLNIHSHNLQQNPIQMKKCSSKHLPAIFRVVKQTQYSKCPIHSELKKRKISLLKHSLSNSKERMIGKSPKQSLRQFIEKEKLILNGRYRLFLNQRPNKLKISSLIPARDPRNQARLQ